MNTLSPTHFQLLKNEVLSVAGIKTITPADCKILSIQINQETNQVISETTLKRMFGFALSKFNPSQYTIDLMAKYCGYDGWKDFCEKKEQGYVEVTSEDIDWHILKKNAATITDFTLQALKNRSGIPYGQTIARRFFNDHMDDFIASDHRATVFAAPSGYGKSIALCHWVDEMVQQGIQKNNDDIILFFSSHALMSALHSGKDLMNWLLALLGYSADKDMRAFTNLIQSHDGKFYLVIDGFDPCLLKNDHFNLWLTLLGDMLTLHGDRNFFKLVLTMRSSTWMSNLAEWEEPKYNWFAGLNADNEYANVPLFSCKEIAELRSNINPADEYPVGLKAAQVLNNPTYFQNFYKLNKSNFYLRMLDNIAPYEIIASFVSNKIYLCLNSSEKIALIIGIVEQMDIRGNNYSVDKLKVNSLLKQNAGVYQELLAIGLFKEVNQSDDFHYDNTIRFTDNNLLDYFIATTLLHINGNQFDDTLIQNLDKLLINNPRKLAVLKWCMVDAVKTGQQERLALVTKVDLCISQKAEMINFIGDLLKKESTSAKGGEVVRHYFSQSYSEDLFDYFFGVELINTEYKATLANLLKLQLTNRQQIMVHTALATIAIIQLDLNSLEKGLTELERFTVDAYFSFPINPLTCLDAIYHYLKYGFIKKQALAELTRVSFDLAGRERAGFKECAVNDMLFLLAIYTLTLNDNPAKILRFVGILNKLYRTQVNGTPSTPFHFFTTLQLADAYYKLNKHCEVASLYETLSDQYSGGEGLLTPFMKALFFSLKIKLFVNKNEELLVANELKYVNAITENSGNKFPRVYILMLLLRNNNYMTEHPGFKKQAGYEYNMILNKSGIDKERFPIDPGV